MPSYDDFVRDYWAPDRDQVLADMQAQQQQAALQTQQQAAGGYGGYNPGGYAGNYGGTGQAGYYGGGQQQGGDPNAFRDAWLGSGGRTVSDLKAFVAAHPEYGATLGGSKGDKVYGPGGQYWADAVIAAGEGGKGASWQTDTGGGGGGGGQGSFSYSQFQGANPFDYKDFVAPTGLTEENDPGYQARLALGQQGVERSAAANGTLLTGGTLKDINTFGQNFASNEFQNVYNRARDEYDANRGNQFQNYQTNYNNAFNTWKGNFDASNTGFQNNQAAQNQTYNQLYQTAGLGLQGANSYGQLSQNNANTLSGIYDTYGTNAGNTITNQGNAAGASQIAQGNAYGNMYNQFGNTGLYAAGQSASNKSYQDWLKTQKTVS